MNEIIRYDRYDFPVISISDCLVSIVKTDNNTVIIKFDDIGFLIRNNVHDCYHRAKESSLILHDCDMENIDIFLLLEKEISGEKCRIKEYLDFDEFVDKIKKKLWKFEIIQEYRSEMGSLFVGRIKGEKIKADCYLQIDYKQLGFKYYEEASSK